MKQRKFKWVEYFKLQKKFLLPILTRLWLPIINNGVTIYCATIYCIAIQKINNTYRGL